MEEVETNCGIYFVINKVNGKYYIGSSEDLPKRLNDHERNLRLKKHENERLAADCVKYGHKAFVFLEIDYMPKGTDRLCLLFLEQLYIDYYQPKYNIQRDVFSFYQYSKDQSPRWVVLRPDGAEELVISMQRYCRENGLHFGCMRQVADGISSNHKGYRARRISDRDYRYKKSDRQKVLDACVLKRKHYLIIAEDGSRQRIIHMDGYCRENGIKKSTISACISRGDSFKGCRFFKIDKDQDINTFDPSSCENGQNYHPIKWVYLINTEELEFIGFFENKRRAAEFLGIQSAWLTRMASEHKLYKNIAVIEEDITKDDFVVIKEPKPIRIGQTDKQIEGHKKRRKAYLVIHRDGEREIVDYLVGYCKDHGLNRSAVAGATSRGGSCCDRLFFKLEPGKDPNTVVAHFPDEKERFVQDLFVYNKNTREFVGYFKNFCEAQKTLKITRAALSKAYYAKRTCKGYILSSVEIKEPQSIDLIGLQEDTNGPHNET